MRCALDWSPAIRLRKPSRSFFSPSVEASSDRSAGSAGGERRLSPRAFLVRAADASLGEMAIGFAAAVAVVVAQLAQRPLLVPPPCGQTFATGGRPLDDLFDQAVLERLRSRRSDAADDHLDRELVRRARQALRAAGAGNRPSFTSGRPSLASLVATRKWHASATPRPPPSAVP